MQRVLLIVLLALAGVSRIQLPSAEARPAGAATVHHTYADDAYEMDDWRRSAELYFALPDRVVVEAPRATAARHRPTASV
jgi:hypothetical protein